MYLLGRFRDAELIRGFLCQVGVEMPDKRVIFQAQLCKDCCLLGLIDEC